MEFDDGLDAAVVRTARGEVRQERVAPPPQGPAEPCDLRDRTGVERLDDCLRVESSRGQVWLPVGVAQLLGAPPRDFHFALRCG